MSVSQLIQFYLCLTKFYWILLPHLCAPAPILQLQLHSSSDEDFSDFNYASSGMLRTHWRLANWATCTRYRTRQHLSDGQGHNMQIGRCAVKHARTKMNTQMIRQWERQYYMKMNTQIIRAAVATFSWPLDSKGPRNPNLVMILEVFCPPRQPLAFHQTLL